jgi:hypothetical protein
MTASHRGVGTGVNHQQSIAGDAPTAWNVAPAVPPHIKAVLPELTCTSNRVFEYTYGTMLQHLLFEMPRLQIQGFGINYSFDQHSSNTAEICAFWKAWHSGL